MDELPEEDNFGFGDNNVVRSHLFMCVYICIHVLINKEVVFYIIVVFDK